MHIDLSKFTMLNHCNWEYSFEPMTLKLKFDSAAQLWCITLWGLDCPLIEKGVTPNEAAASLLARLRESHARAELALNVFDSEFYG